MIQKGFRRFVLEAGNINRKREETAAAKCFGERIDLAAAGPGGQDYKTRLQELCARSFDQLPAYDVSDQGPDHAKEFEAVVRIRDRQLGFGRSRCVETDNRYPAAYIRPRSH